MKKLILINGTMGVGKTTASHYLLDYLQPAVFLDGDWCWMMRPFVVNDESKALVLDNISYLLNNFLRASLYDYVIFAWVMQTQAILDDVRSRLAPGDYQTYCFTLTSSAESLTRRLQANIKAGLRQGDVLERSLARLPLYEKMATIKIDTTDLTTAQTARPIAALVSEKFNGKEP